MDNQRIHLQHVITVKKMVVQMILQIEICSVFANGTTTITTIRNWFKRFRAGNFDLKDKGASAQQR